MERGKKFPLITFSLTSAPLYFLLRSTKYATASNPATANSASKPGGVGEGEGEGVGVGVVGATGETAGEGVGVGVGVGVGETVGEGDGVGDGTAAKISTVFSST